MLTQRLTLLVLLAAIGLFLGINLLSSRFLAGWQFDATEGGIYTLSDGTESVLKELPEPIRFTLYYSAEAANGIPMIQTYAERVTTLLKKFAQISGGKVELTILNPEPFSETEDDAVLKGIQAIPLDDVGRKLYFGLVMTSSTDKTEVMPFLDPEREAFLEYDLVQAAYKLAHDHKPVLGILSGWQPEGGPDPMLGGTGGEPFTLKTQLAELFEVQEIPLDSITIPDEVNVLMLVHPPKLSDSLLRALDHYVVNGGSLMVFTDPASDYPGAAPASDLQPLLSHWGVTMAEQFVVADRRYAMRVPGAEEGFSGGSLRFQTRLNYLKLDKEAMDDQDVATADLQEIHYINGGHWQVDEARLKQTKLDWKPLLSSSEDAMEVTPEEAKKLRAVGGGYNPSGERWALAGRLHGRFPAAYQETRIPEQQKAATVILVADADLLRDQWWLQMQNFFGQQVVTPVADNGRLVLNWVEQLSGSEAMIGLRSRSVASRPFHRVEALKTEAEARFRQHEEALKARMLETEQKLQALAQPGQQAKGLVLSPEQEEALTGFRQQLLDIRGELRKVQHALRREIESLGSWLKFIHIALIPALAVVAGLLLPRLLMRRTAGRAPATGGRP